VSIPDMPSQAYIWAPLTAPVLVSGPIDCRLVPMTWLWHGRPHVGGFVGQTHWMDYDISLTSITGGLRFPTSGSLLGYVLVEDQTPVIAICTASENPEYFLALFSEVRYADTPNAYHRTYLRKCPVPIDGIESPCG